MAIPNGFWKYLKKTFPTWKQIKAVIDILPIIPKGNYVGDMKAHHCQVNSLRYYRKEKQSFYFGYILWKDEDSWNFTGHAFNVVNGKVEEHTILEPEVWKTGIYLGVEIPKKDIPAGRYDHKWKISYIKKLLKSQVKGSTMGALKNSKKNRPDSGYDTKQLKIGIKVEMEHTDNPIISKIIAKDHLDEHKNYYTRLLRMEKGAEVKANKIIANCIMQASGEHKEFFKLYPQVAGKIKKIPKMKDEDAKRKALEGLTKATEGLKQIKEALE